MTLQYFVEKHFNKIKSLVNKKAFDYNINRNDLQSFVNIKLAIKINANSFNSEIAIHDNIFFGWFIRFLDNAARDFIETPYQRSHYIEIQGSGMQKCEQPDFEKADFLKQLCEIYKDDVIFDSYFLSGLTNEKISGQLKCPVNTVKGKVFKLRKKINHIYGEIYRELSA